MTEPHVVLVGGSDQLLEQCATALAGLCSVAHDEDAGVPEFGAPRTVIRSHDAELILLSFARVIQHGLAHTKTLRDLCKPSPLVLMAAEHEVPMSRDLLCALVDHVISLPTTTNHLRRDVAAVLNLKSDTLVPEETVAPCNQLDPQERRHGMRADVPADQKARVTFDDGSGALRFGVANLSLRQAGWLGGMLLRPLPGDVSSTAAATIDTGQALAMQLQLPQNASPIRFAGRVVMVTRSAEQTLQSLAIQYEVDDATDAEALSRFWFHIQLDTT